MDFHAYHEYDYSGNNVSFWEIFYVKSARKINDSFGYRTSMSMKNKDTWQFAHIYCGRIWFYSGFIALPLSVVLQLTPIGRSEDGIGTVGGIACGIQLVALVGAIFPTEMA